MKRLLVFSISFLLAISVVGNSEAQKIKIRLGHAASSKHPFHDGTKMFKDGVEKRTQGQVEISLFGDRQLGDDRQLLEGVKLGTIDAALVSSVTFSLIVKKYAFDALQLPFLIDSYEFLSIALTSPVARKMLDDLDSVGIKGLGFVEAGQRHFLSSKGPVLRIEDFKGLKTRIVPVPLHKITWETVGANPVGIAYGEVYTSMQTGVIDAVEFNISSIETEHLYENAKDLTLTGHYFWPGVLIYNKSKFDKLPANVQQAMLESGWETIEEHAKFVGEQEGLSAERIKKKGVKIHKLTMLPEMKDRMKPIVEQWVGKDPLIEEFVQYVQENQR
jgi:tripartite ATP-independent transporter DctP family solute receptor